ncbi:MAG TPA: hypothetical protein VH933_04655 [Aestuariivirgaceae bacterium]|jgi:hypothetical protein
MRLQRIGEKQVSPLLSNDRLLMDIGGYLWLIIDVLFVAGLAAAIIYASYHWRRKSKSRETEEAEKQAVKRVYRD